MIHLDEVSKGFRTPSGVKPVLAEATQTFPAGRSIALLGRNGAGKSTLLKMISGVLDPDRGHIRRTGTVSWPIGFAGSFHPDLTGAQNTRFIARVYGADTDALVQYTKDFSQLGAFFHMPFRTYSSGMRSRLAFGVSMGIRFDFYLVDEVTSVGDAAFREKCDWVITNRLKNAGAIVVSHSMQMLRRLCDAAMVLEDGKLIYFDDVERAIATHEQQLLGSSQNPSPR